MANLRAGVLGLGVMGRHHSRVLNALDGVDFLGVYDPADTVGPDIEGKPIVKELDRFLDMGFDYCVVAAPTIYHLDIGTALAERASTRSSRSPSPQPPRRPPSCATSSPRRGSSAASATSSATTRRSRPPARASRRA